MMIKIRLHIEFCFLIAIPLFLIAQKSFSQSIYPNIDFENGTFSGWNASTGSCCPIETPVNGFISGRHVILSGNATDPYSLGQIPVVVPGGSYSVRLGNDSVGSEAEKLSYTFTVSHLAPLFVYRYAVVFQFPPDHPAVKQPRFEITVKDQNQNLIDCGFYQVACANNIPGFIANGEYRFKNWTDVGVDLTDYIGQQVTIEFATGDCGMGGHFGYAYLDGYATELKITNNGCNPDGSITFTAPPGFNYQWSNGEISQQAIFINAVPGSEITVTLSAATGCEKILSHIVPDFIPKADYFFDLNCDNEVEFFDESSVNNAVIINYQWNFGDGNFSQDVNPVHQFNSGNSYPVTLTVMADNNCKSAMTSVVNVEPVVKAGYNFTENICEGEKVSFTDHSYALTGNIISWLWNFDDHSTSALQNPFHFYLQAGTYHPNLIVTTDEGCTDAVSKLVFIKGKNECDQENEFSLFIPNAFSPNGDGVNDLFSLEGNNFSELQIEIFNRWGEIVFRNPGMPVDWNGKNADNKSLPEGVYVYSVQVKDLSGKTRHYKGYVLLLR